MICKVFWLLKMYSNTGGRSELPYVFLHSRIEEQFLSKCSYIMVVVSSHNMRKIIAI